MPVLVPVITWRGFDGLNINIVMTIFAWLAKTYHSPRLVVK